MIASGKDHYNWMGDKVSEAGGRDRARKMYKLTKCRCGSMAMDRHHKNENTADNRKENISLLCRRCHMEEDGRLVKFVALKLKRQKPKNCVNCSRPYKPMRHGRCEVCSSYLRLYGKERAKNPGHLNSRKNPPSIILPSLKNRKSRAMIPLLLK